jgi:D-alanyl-D-alanine carboxypeptidase (penicillin-binding protein 5/6)
MANASTTKMLTALVAITEADLDDEVEIPQTVAAVTGGRLSLEPGEQLSVRELLYVLLLSSSNHAATALAEHVAGTERAFVDQMNELAVRLGAGSTQVLTSHGLDTPGHVSSAHDLALIGKHLLDDPLLAEIVSAPAASVTSSRRMIELENTNELLESYRGAVGIKTGFTLQAGNVLVAAAIRRGRRVLAVAMGSDDAFQDAEALLDHGFARLSRGLLVTEGDTVGSIVFDPSGSLLVQASGSVRGLPLREAVTVRFEPFDDPGGPVAAGAAVGRVVVLDGDRILGAVDGLATRDVDRSEPGLLERILASGLRLAARVPGLR